MTSINKQHVGLHLGDTHDVKNAENAMFGFWLFLMTDLVLFALLFAIYITSIGVNAGAPGPKEIFDFTSLFIQTMLLLLSSFTCGMVSIALKHHASKKTLLNFMGLTLLLGFGFLALEINDFMNMFAMSAYPTKSSFLSSFFVLVPMHGLHITFGAIWLIVIMIQVMKIGLIDIVKTRIMRFSLFWHFLDLIWIGIFTVVYFGGWSYG